MSTPAQILTDYYDKILVDRDSAAALAFWTDETKLYYPGQHRFSGLHVGVSWVTDEYYPAIRAEGGMMRKEELLSPIVGDDKYAISHYHERLVMQGLGDELLMSRRCLYGFSNGRITTVRVFDEAPEEINDFFNRHYSTDSSAPSIAASGGAHK